MKLNLLVRIKNKAFWVTLIPLLALLAQLIAGLFGFSIDLTEISGKLVAIVDAVFAILAVLGLANDPTTKGFGDSQRALTYTEPWDDDAKGVTENK